jgi:hypothetical protein
MQNNTERRMYAINDDCLRKELPKGIGAESDGRAAVAVNIRCGNGCDDSGWGRCELIRRKRQELA